MEKTKVISKYLRKSKEKIQKQKVIIKWRQNIDFGKESK